MDTDVNTVVANELIDSGGVFEFREGQGGSYFHVDNVTSRASFGASARENIEKALVVFEGTDFSEGSGSDDMVMIVVDNKSSRVGGEKSEEEVTMELHNRDWGISILRYEFNFKTEVDGFVIVFLASVCSVFSANTGSVRDDGIGVGRWWVVRFWFRNRHCRKEFSRKGGRVGWSAAAAIYLAYWFGLSSDLYNAAS